MVVRELVTSNMAVVGGSQACAGAQMWLLSTAGIAGYGFLAGADPQQVIDYDIAAQRVAQGMQGIPNQGFSFDVRLFCSYSACVATVWV